MKAVVVEEPNEVVVKEVPDPKPSVGEALIKVDSCGICGTDIHVIRGEFAPTRYPIIPGHEFCGEVVELGSGVGSLRTGDFVAVDPSLFDGTCVQCRAGRFNLCENWNGIGVGRTDGACAELVAVPAVNAFRSSRSLARFTGSTRSAPRSRRTGSSTEQGPWGCSFCSSGRRAGRAAWR
jgi:threonine dehydrogenase-like Zn-dependent dehydrogenase